MNKAARAVEDGECAVSVPSGVNIRFSFVRHGDKVEFPFACRLLAAIPRIPRGKTNVAFIRADPGLPRN